MNRELLSIICTMSSRGVLICSSLQTPALHTTETLTGILLREKEKTYSEEKAQMCYVFTLPREELKALYIHFFFAKRHQAVPAAMCFVYARACLCLVLCYGRPSLV